MKKLLVPTDFSQASHNAVKYSVELAKEFDSQITLFNAFHPLPYNPESYAYISNEEMDAVRLNSHDTLSQLSNIINTELKTPSTYECSLGLAADEVEKIEKTLNPDLIVVGSHGSSNFERAIMGGTTLALAKGLSTPMLVIPEKSKYKSIDKILFATDFHDNDISSIKDICAFAEHFDSKVIAVHVTDNEHLRKYERDAIVKFSDSIMEKVGYDNLEFELVDDNDVEHGLNSFIKKNEIDLLVLAKSQRSFFSRLIMPSITNKMVYHTDIPMLIIKAEDKD